MVSLSFGSVALATALSIFSAMTPEDSEVAKTRTVVLTERQYDQTFTVTSGDQLLLRLPMSLPLVWAPVQGKDTLRKVEQPPPPPERKEWQGDVPNVGGFSLSDQLYKVLAKPGSKITVEWMYSYLGRPEKTAQRLKAKPPPFPPPDDKLPEKLREGMIYRVQLNVVPPPVTAKKSTTENTARNAKIPGQKARILSCVLGR